jgi:hypothetical protein
MGHKGKSTALRMMLTKPQQIVNGIPIQVIKKSGNPS